jgi:hypothetical protein
MYNVGLIRIDDKVRFLNQILFFFSNEAIFHSCSFMFPKNSYVIAETVNNNSNINICSELM